MRKSNLRATAAWQALALLGAGALATPAFAQETTAPASSETAPAAEEQPALSPENQQDSDDAIVVTGSRLVRPELDAPSPVTTVDSETFDLTGTVTVETLLNELPQLIPGNTRTSNNQGGEDFSTLDLRGLGPNRTLILVDGERVPASSTTGVVDIGTIPAGLIERVDVVTGGASAVYGSDAMAGVVNFILKDNYEGMEVTSQYGITDHGDGGTFNIQGLLGGNFGDDRGNLTFFTSYYTREGIGQGDRDITRNQEGLTYDYDLGQYFVPEFMGHLDTPRYFTGPVTGATQFNTLAACRAANGSTAPLPNNCTTHGQVAIGAGSGTPPWGWITNNPDNPFTGLATNPATAAQFGAADVDCDPTTAGVAVNGGNLSFNDLGQLTPRFVPSTGINSRELCSFANRAAGSSRYNFNPVNFLVTPYQRWNMALTGRYDISDAIRLKVVANYTDSTQTVSLAPTPVTGLTINPNNVFIIANGACGVNSCHPDLLAALQSRTGDPADGLGPDAPFTMDRRWSEAGPRIGDTSVKTATLRGTLSGPLAHGFNWDTTLSYGRTNADQVLQGNTNRTAAFQGLNNTAMVDPDGAGPLGPVPVCTGSGILPGCVPIDIFGPNTLDPTMVAFTTIDTKENRFFDQARIAGNITGNIVDLPAGPLGIAIGAEARTDRGDITVDDAQRTGNIYGFNATQDQHGKVNVKEIYGEARVPILADLPFIHEFSIEAGARYSDYSSVGGLFNWKLGAQFAPLDWMKFRAIFNKASRAPSVVELFQNGDQGFPAYADPCNGGGDDATVLAICQQQVVDAGGAPGFDFSDFGQNNSQVQAFAFGTTDLSEESAKTFTVGAVLTPNLGLGRFSATVDYYNIKIKDVIAAVGAQANLNACYGGGFPVLDAACANILRDPVTGQVVAVNTSVANQASLETKGVDVGINYSVPFSDLGIGIGGRLRFQELLSWLDSFKFNDTEFGGGNGGGIGGALPEWKSSATLAYDSDDFTAQLRWNWQSDVEDTALCNVGANCIADGPGADAEIKGLSYFDLSLRKSIGNNFELTGIVQNLFNQKAEHTAGGFFAEGGMDIAYWNPIILGRTFTIQGRVKL
jgi:outer membrane receptor protein involved in Fe transport